MRERQALIVLHRLAIFLSLICALSGCFGMAPPPGLQNERSFTRDSTKSYLEAYKIIAKQMRACYRAIGFFGNGYDVQADLDTANTPEFRE